MCDDNVFNDLIEKRGGRGRGRGGGGYDDYDDDGHDGSGRGRGGDYGYSARGGGDYGYSARGGGGGGGGGGSHGYDGRYGRGGRGRGRGSGEQKSTQQVERVYVIMYDAQYVFFPVKANPRWKNYFAGMPNFFGGGVNEKKGEDHVTALKREVDEESINCINISSYGPPAFQRIHSGENEKGIYTFYRLFYSVTNISFTGKGVFGDFSFLGMKKKVEQQAIVRMPITYLLSLGAHPSAPASAHPTATTTTTEPPPSSSGSTSPLEDRAGVIVEEMRKIINDLYGIQPNGIDEWNGSETKIAFEKFIGFLLNEQQRKG